MNSSFSTHHSALLKNSLEVESSLRLSPLASLALPGCLTGEPWFEEEGWMSADAVEASRLGSHACSELSSCMLAEVARWPDGGSAQAWCI
jgi:hypothetical protein